eukprot:scaffold650_cov407-Prasinococcus_capsulatus_cf.AAC.37
MADPCHLCISLSPPTSLNHHEGDGDDHRAHDDASDKIGVVAAAQALGQQLDVADRAHDASNERQHVLQAARRE